MPWCMAGSTRRDLEFDYYLADVEELNRRAFTGEPDITKISSYAYAYAADKYLILDSGGAIGTQEWASPYQQAQD